MIKYRNTFSLYPRPITPAKDCGFYRCYEPSPGVSHVKKYDGLVRNMTDWRLEVDLEQLND